MMIFLESLLLTLLIVVLIYSSYTDCRYGFIYNNQLQKTIPIAAIVGLLYYLVPGGYYFYVALENWLLLAMIAFGFYSLHIWAGGDSKLLLFIGLCIPGRLYTLQSSGELSGMIIIACSFIFAFCWLICRSLYLGIRNKDILKIRWHRIQYKRMLASYFMMVGIIQTIDIFIRPKIAESLLHEQIAFLGMYCLLVLGLISIRDQMKTRLIAMIAMSIWILLGVGTLRGNIMINMTIAWRVIPLVLVFALLLLRMVLEKYNYKTIPTADVSAKQILSAATIMGFSRSRVQGLPQGMTEDLRSRITEEEAASVRRWEYSKYGKAEIVIVQKLPFAIFLTLGVVVFFVFEVVDL